MKKILSILLILSAVCLAAHAVLIGSPQYITVSTNSPVISAGSLTVNVPGYIETVTGLTNGATQFTNNMIESFTTNGVTYTVIASSVVSASGSTASFSVTNAAAAISVPAYNLLNIAPQSGGSNTFYLQAQ